MSMPRTADGTGVAVVLGTRAEIVTLAPVVHELGALTRVIFTDQEDDPDLAASFVASCLLHPPEVRLSGIAGRPRGARMAGMLAQLHDRFAAARPAAVVVRGGSDGANAAAQAAHYAGIRVVQVGAGLRAAGRGLPAEVNRLVVTAVADVHCCATAADAKALMDAGASPAAIHITGSPLVEATRASLPCRARRLQHVRRFGLEPDGYALATLHHPENTDDPERLQAVLGRLGMLGMPVLLPLHPGTRRRIDDGGLHVPDDVLAVPPLDHPTFLSLADESRILVTDSGGVQEEATVLGRPVVVVRDAGERPEAVESGFALVGGPAEIGPCARRLLEPAHLARLRATPSPYGDGLASERIATLAAHAAGAELVRTGALLDELAAS